MKQFSYNTSPGLRFAISEFEQHRQRIVLTPLSPKDELRSRWDTLINRIHALLTLAGYTTSKKDLTTVLTEMHTGKTRGTTLALIGGIKEATDLIRRSYLVSSRHITIQTIETLTSTVYPKELGLYARALRTHEAAINGLLDYLSPQQEHPLITASVAFIHMLAINPFDRDSTILASLLFHLFLHTKGYDARGLICVESLWQRDKEIYEGVTTQARESGNYTAWLEYAAQTAVTNLSDIEKSLNQPAIRHELPGAFFDLNDRQHAILSILEQPDQKISNKDVKKRFKISQITASRDLSKLSRLGLLYPHGKGRSVYYTRV